MDARATPECGHLFHASVRCCGRAVLAGGGYACHLIMCRHSAMNVGAARPVVQFGEALARYYGQPWEPIEFQAEDSFPPWEAPGGECPICYTRTSRAA